MANNSDLEAMGLTPQEIAYVETMSRAGALSAGAGGAQMQAQNNAIHRNNIIKEVLAKRGGSAGAGTGTQSNQSSSQSSFSGIADPESFQLVKNLLTQMAGGGTEAFKQAQAQKNAGIEGIDAALADYSKQAAFTDAAALTQQSLNKAMEAQKPVIQKAIEGSGTSAGSMQALLSQKLANEAALAAGALGAEQARAYGQISTNLFSNRGTLTTGKDDSLDPITKLAELLKVSSSQSAGSSSSNFNPMTNPYATTRFSTAGQQQVGGGNIGNIGASDYGLGVDTGSSSFNPRNYFY